VEADQAAELAVSLLLTGRRNTLRTRYSDSESATTRRHRIDGNITSNELAKVSPSSSARTALLTFRPRMRLQL
jgi:hypothetical protein